MIRPKSQAIMLVFLLFWPFMVFSQTQRGDINGDGILDESDISALVNAYLKNESPTTVTDLDGDNSITIADVTTLISITTMYTASGNHNGHGYVDLGLPSGTLWATCNIDCTLPYESGGAYAWGEIETKEDYSWDTYKWSNGKPTKDAPNLTKYCDRDAYGPVDGKMTLEPDDDVAHVKWGGSWHIPTDTEFEELMTNCTFVWTKLNNVVGYRFTGPNGRNLFIPAGTVHTGTNSYNKSFEYWSSSLRPSSHGTNANNFNRVTGSDVELRITGSLRYDGDLIRPVVSELKPIVHDNTAPKSYLDHDLVDLGLPSGTLWATCNIGASSVEDYGCYFAWGEIESSCDGKVEFWDGNYKFYSDKFATEIFKYNFKTENGYVDNLEVLETEDDAAAQIWGGEWRMPTQTQMSELKNKKYTSWTWTTINGINGYLVTSLVEGYTDKSIFFPAAGYHDRSKLNHGGEQGHYWSSTLDLDYDYAGVAYYLFFKSTGYGTGTTDRTFGRTIRPVVLISSINK